MKIEISGGFQESILLVAKTDEWKGDITKNEGGFIEKVFHIYIEDNHLFIVDNHWNSIALKSYSYSNWKDRFTKGIDKKLAGKDYLKQKSMRSKSMLIDGICIDLTKNDECESLRKGRERAKKKTKKAEK